ncbi:glutaminase B [Pseudoalteromonas tunicata]|uniref:glutaminase B n=1 Tax=Pseudoalteromonas tunicata TaxID=314281 RepID=UPI00273D7424|nr:glutaminase B [Pseudoalteromonas tunicata]MDP5212276.1 glutaminase B [Pseudoalteromonas tunicata]
MPQFNDILQQISQQARCCFGQGKVANYIPALADVPAKQFSIAIHTVDGQTFSAGDAHATFSIQSVSKALTLTLAMQHHGDEIWRRVGKEPSGTAFNSLAQLEFETGIPRNPFINAGALVVCDALVSRVSAPVFNMLETARLLSANDKVVINKKVADSEYQHRHRNAAMAHLMKSFNNFDNDVDTVLRAYFSYCAIEMSSIELAKTFSYLANQGVCVQSGRQMLSAKQTQQVNSLLFTSGLYDAAGDFAFRVGIPAKSGVGGGIIGIVPGKFTVCVWSPELNEFGNSVAGLYALELLAEKLHISML